ncbi:uncharacterized protein [Anabrus simplex]|uniref:uncharacterized protein n=1 Tax=Anabrus simplex TaxID=316456 RepID=UPI0035A2CBEA
MPPISRPASATYWTPPTVRLRRLSELPSTNTRVYNDSSHSSSNSSSRNYIDPWDLENYAYMKRHLTDGSEYMTSTPALESSQSDFYYVPHYQDSPYYTASRYQPESMLLTDESIGLFAGIEEEDFYNEQYELPYKRSPILNSKQRFQNYRDTVRYKSRLCVESHSDYYGGNSYDDESSGSEPGCQLYSPSLLVRRPPGHLVYVYGTGRGRKMALPRPDFSGSDAVPSSDDASVLEDPPVPCPCSRPPASRFGLSKHGHLQIDYSCSWDSLDRYIATD